jgi:1,4-alpha-glucan branching enzyme
MPASQEHVNAHTPLGANLVAGGAVFRVWAPRAQEVHISGDFNDWTQEESTRLVKDAAGYWAGFVPVVEDGDHYKFFVVGAGGRGYKRDPYARELSEEPAYPLSNCIVRDPNSYPWHDHDYRAPAFNDLIVYQFHVGTFYGPNRTQRVARFLDVLERLDYLVALGVTAIEPLPIVEFASPRSLGYDGSDIFSPEMDFNIDPPELAPYLDKVNALLQRRGQPPLTTQQLAVPINQLKVLIDIFHLYGIAVIFDVVYNHAGLQVIGQDESIYFMDRAAGSDPNDSLYFTTQWHTGPVFAFFKQEVRQFLIDNAAFFLDEYHADGFRYDQVSVIVKQNTDGWRFCQNLTSTARHREPSAAQIAEYWNVDPYVVRQSDQGGAGFDVAWHDGLRESVRSAIAQAAAGRNAHVDLDRIAAHLYAPGFPATWKAVQYVESHDEVKEDREPRIAALADSTNARSWYARSRTRVATGLVLTAPGIPMLFMGQEFIEDKPWSDNPGHFDNTLIWWDGLEQGDKAMVDHLRFTQELISLRRRQPALRGEPINVFHVHNDNRVLAFHRWIEGHGRDVVVVASLNESTLWDYQLGLPGAGRWLEVFNSDIYDNWVNPWVAGNGGGIDANGPPVHQLPASARIVLPANSLLVFARDTGD